MTLEERLIMYLELHNILDRLFSQYIIANPGKTSEVSVYELMKWSHALITHLEKEI